MKKKFQQEFEEILQRLRENDSTLVAFEMLDEWGLQDIDIIKFVFAVRDNAALKAVTIHSKKLGKIGLEAISHLFKIRRVLLSSDEKELAKDLESEPSVNYLFQYQCLML